MFNWQCCALATKMGGLCCHSSSGDEPSTSVIPRRADEIETAPTGRLLIFANPNSGSGNALKTFREMVQPQLKKNKIEFELIVTKSTNHASREVSEREDMGSFNGIMILSGDGLVFEVINGLATRDDAVEMLSSIPIGIVPSGSGNGLLSSFFASKGFSLKNPDFVRKAIEVVSSEQPVAYPVSLMQVHSDKDRWVAFLSLGWGIMADIDLRTYKGRLQFLPYTGSGERQSNTFNIYEKNVSQRMSELSMESETDTELQQQQQQQQQQPGENRNQSFPNGFPGLERPVPDDWITIDDEFIGVYAVTLSHISQDGIFMPQAKMLDDRIYLTYILKRDVSSRFDLISFLTNIEKGTHLEMKFVHTVEVSALRLSPANPKPLLVVDGEVVRAKRLQAHVIKEKTAIIGPP